MIKAIFQGLFILTLIIGVSIAEAILPLALPEAQSPNRFYHPDGLEGTLAGWQECRAAGLRLAKERGHKQIDGHCTNGYAVAQNASVDFSDIRVHDEASSCAFGTDDYDNTPYQRFLSATVRNGDRAVHVARVRLEAANPTNLADRTTNVIDVWLEPGAKAHRCLGIVFGFETAAAARHFDTMVSHIKIEPLKVYGVSNRPTERPADPGERPFGRLPDETNI